VNIKRLISVKGNTETKSYNVIAFSGNVSMSNRIKGIAKIQRTGIVRSILMRHFATN